MNDSSEKLTIAAVAAVMVPIWILNTFGGLIGGIWLALSSHFWNVISVVLMASQTGDAIGTMVAVTATQVGLVIVSIMLLLGVELISAFTFFFVGLSLVDLVAASYVAQKMKASHNGMICHA